MTDTEIEPASSPPAPPAPAPTGSPLQRHQQLHVDAFCTGCGYNLHGQPVTRDERTGIFLCRCPECGQYHAAGLGVTAASAWAAQVQS